MASGKTAVVNNKRCVACGACENQCPKAAIKVYCGCYAAVTEDNCVGVRYVFKNMSCRQHKLKREVKL